MNTNTIPFDDFDPESQDFFQGMKFLDLNTIGLEGRQNEVEEALSSVRTNKSFEEISNEIAMRSPFVKNSLFYTSPLKTEDLAINEESEKWIFRYHESSRGTELMNLYRKYDESLANSLGKSDNEYDFMIYVETNYKVNLGKVLLIKMSNAMINYYYNQFAVNPKTSFLKQLSESVYKLCKDNEGFSATVEDIENAFFIEVKYRPNVNNGLVKQTLSEQTPIFFSAVSQKIRGIKIDRENWDPTLNSDRYKLESLHKGIDYLTSRVKEYRNEVSNVRKFLEIAKNLFNSESSLLDGWINVLLSLEKELMTIEIILQTQKNSSKEFFAFVCGMINGVFEFFCGLVDVILLILQLIASTAFKEQAEVKLDLIELREGLEELVESLLEDPDFLKKKFNEIIKAYEYNRRGNPNLTKYQVQHNNGEDLILAIDIIISFIVIVKAITKSTKYLPKFTEWIDDVVENGGKGARILENNLVDDYIRLSDELVEATKSKTLFQKTNNLDELYKAAQVAKKELETITTNFAVESKGKAGFRDGLKSRERALEKINSDYYDPKIATGDTSRLVDIAGSKVVYETIDDLYIALNKFNKEFKILKIKDRFQKPLPSGYRDILINIEMKNGHIVEFRLHLKEMDVAAETGHKIYQQRRTLEAISSQRKLTTNEKELIETLIFKEKKIYESAWNKVINNKK